MSASSYNRGSAAISRDADEAARRARAAARNERRAQGDDRARLLAKIAELESRLHKSERARLILRETLTAEREARRDEQAVEAGNYLFAVRTLAKAAGLDGAGRESLTHGGRK